MNVVTIKNWLDHQLSRVHSRLIARSFKHYLPSRIHYTAQISHPQFISNYGVSIGRGVWLYAIIEDTAGNNYSPELILGKGTQIGDYCHITCATRLEIGENVLLAQSVFIADSNHNYCDISMPILQQGLSAKPITIGAGSWLGNHAVVVGCSIGRNCVVGANSVVTRDVPDYCVVVGAPAKIIKRYEATRKEWVRQD
ncbi:MAG: acyltransferase [bacterium]